MKSSSIKYVLILTLAFSVSAEKTTYKEIQWVELMPPEDIKALYNPPKELFDIPEGSEDDEISDQVFDTLMKTMDSGYQEALSSTKIIESLNKAQIKIPGFVVPVKIEGDRTTEFFIVPYFGACMHYPPPPPNQTIFAKYETGFYLNKIYEPYVFSGMLTTTIMENEIAVAAYYLQIKHIEDYKE